jgi:hypothetical protein
MRKLMISFVFLATVAATSSAAWAGGSPASLGVGAEAVFTGDDGIGGISANYDLGAMHFGGYLGVSDPAGADNTTLQLGGRFFYHLHSSAMADFGVGGTLAYANVPTATDEKADLVYLVPGFQIRAFVASNVALSFSSGIALGLGDADGVALNGQLTSSAGIHYYFF